MNFTINLIKQLIQSCAEFPNMKTITGTLEKKEKKENAIFKSVSIN